MARHGGPPINLFVIPTLYDIQENIHHTDDKQEWRQTILYNITFYAFYKHSFIGSAG